MVRRVTFEPSASIAYISVLPSRLDTNAILRPSGDQSGNTSKLKLWVSCVTFEPSGSIVYISPSPDTNAMRPLTASAVCVVESVGIGAGESANVGSGAGASVRAGEVANVLAQDGFESMASELSVSCATLEPSASIVYISKSPSWLDTNAIPRPRGDHSGPARDTRPIAELSVS